MGDTSRGALEIPHSLAPVVGRAPGRLQGLWGGALGVETVTGRQRFVLGWGGGSQISPA